MNKRIDKLKVELREFIELSKTITQGKWAVSSTGDYPKSTPGIETEGAIESIVDDCYQYEGGGVNGLENATFIVRARNISPAMAECLLVAVGCIEAMSIEVNVECSNEALEAYAQDSKLAQEHLEQILAIWEASQLQTST